MKKVIFHIPHDGDEFKDDLIESIIIPFENFRYYHEIMRDTDATLFAPDYPNSQIYKFNVSRLLCDVERFVGSEEIMESYGMGFCYEKVYDGTIIKEITKDLKEKTYKLYSEHHRGFDDLIKNIESCIIVDLHSFSREIIVHRQLNKPLPEVCIGYDDYLPEKYINQMISIFNNNGFSVDINYPYSGSFVPNAIYHKKCKCKCISFMVEVNKECYIKNGIVITKKINGIRSSILEILTTITNDN